MVPFTCGHATCIPLHFEFPGLRFRSDLPRTRLVCISDGESKGGDAKQRGKRKQGDSPLCISPLYVMKRRRTEALWSKRMLFSMTRHEDIPNGTRPQFLAAQHVVDLQLATIPTCCGKEMVLKASASGKTATVGMRWRCSLYRDIKCTPYRRFGETMDFGMRVSPK